jgi:hypothetical protein
MVRRLETLKRLSSSLDPPPNQQKASVATSLSAPQLKSNHQGTSRPIVSKTTQYASQQDFDDFRPDVDDGNEEPRSSEEYANTWATYNKDRNKENRPAPKPNTKVSLLDRQPGAQRVQWNDSQDSEAGPSTQKWTRQESEYEEENEDEQEEEQEEESEDEGFEQDNRIPDPARRTAAPSERRQSPVQDAPPSPKRQRVERPTNIADLGARNHGHRRPQRAETASQASTRPEADHNEDEEDYPPPTITQVTARARAIRPRNNETQKRVPWSEADSHRLIDGIEEFGCSWALIEKNVEFEYPRNQVALKDKARNIKVAYLK